MLLIFKSFNWKESRGSIPDRICSAANSHSALEKVKTQQFHASNPTDD